MKTVGEFKKAGVVFVVEDKCHNLINFSKVVEFAWRDLTTKPDNPQYKIELDIDNHRWRPSLNQSEESPDEQRTGFDNTAQQFEALASDKPVKPIFTQAMADAGELPPVGSECNICCDSSEVFFKGSVIAYFEDLIWLNMGDRNPVRMNCEVRFKPLNTRTDREKAIDEMFEDAKVQGSKGAFERLYDAGYRKC